MPGWALPHTDCRIPSSHPCCVPLRRAWRLFRRAPPAFTSCVAFPLCKHNWHSTRLTIAVIVVIMCVSSFAVRPPTSRVGALSSSSSSFVGGLCGGNTSGMSLRRRSFDFARSTDACRGRRRLVFLCGLRSLVHIYIYIPFDQTSYLHASHSRSVRAPRTYSSEMLLTVSGDLILLGRFASALEGD
jgi:hypothetical protein